MPEQPPAHPSPQVSASSDHQRRTSDRTQVLDQNFRESLLEAYAEEVAGDVPGGLDRSLVQNVLAAVSAVAPLPLGDQALVGALAGFVEVSAPRLMAVVQVPISAGVVVVSNARVRVYPEVVSDAVLETAVVFQGQDLGYAGRIWTALGAASLTTHARSRVITLCVIRFDLCSSAHESP